MKNIFRYIASFLVGAMALAACQQEIAPLGEEISVNPATVSVAGQNAEDATVTVTADGDWIAVVPEWITAAPAYGSAGETTVTLSFADNLDADGTLAAARKATVLFSVNATSAELAVEQAGDPDKAPAEVKTVTCKEFNAAEDGAGPFKVVGTISNIEQISPSTAYNNGNLTITDETGSLYLYRVGPGDGKKLEDLGLAVGDKITVEGKKGSYNGSPQMAQGGVILAVEKSLLSVSKVFPETPLALEGDVLTVTLSCKGEGLEVVIPKEASWLKVASTEQSGELAVVVLQAAANEGGNRTADVEIVTEFNGVKYKAVVTVSQLGAIKAVSVADFIAASEGTALFQLTGKVSAITSAYDPSYGNVSFKLMDATGEVDIFRMTCPENATDLAVGDMITVCGTRASYNGTPQMAKGETYVSHIGNTEVTVAEFLTKEKSKENWYMLTGTIEEIVKEEYGSFYLNDGTGRVYVYGLTKAPVASNDKSFASLGLMVGDVVTLVGTRDRYDNSKVEDQKDQVSGPAYYVSHEAGSAPVEASLDGKQWMADVDGMQYLFDFGLSEEGMLCVAVPSVDGTEYYLYMTGLYEVAPTDGTSGVVTFTSYDWEWDEYGEPVEIPYSDLAEAGVKIVWEGVFGVTDPIALTEVENPYEILVDGGNGGDPEGDLPDGEYWFFNGTKVMAPFAEDVTEGTLPAEDVVNGASTAKNAFTFVYDPDMSKYTIQDSYGRYLGNPTYDENLAVVDALPEGDDAVDYYWVVSLTDEGSYDIYPESYNSFAYSSVDNFWCVDPTAYETDGVRPMLVPAENPIEEPENPGTETKTLTNAEICAAMTSSSTSYTTYAIESASGTWTVNASQLNTNTFLQCRGHKGSYIKTPAFEKDIKSVTIHFSEAKKVYANNIYCVFPATWTAPTTADVAYPEDGNVGKAVTDGSYSLSIPVDAGNRQVCISMIGTYSYYLDHIDVAF